MQTEKMKKMIAELQNVNSACAERLVELIFTFTIPSDRRNSEKLSKLLTKTLKEAKIKESLNSKEIEIDENDIEDIEEEAKAKEQSDFASTRIIPRENYNKLLESVRNVIKKVEKITLPCPMDDPLSRGRNIREIHRLVLTEDIESTRKQLEELKAEFEENYTKNIINQLETFKALASANRPREIVQEINEKIDKLKNTGIFSFRFREFLTPRGSQIEKLLAQESATPEKSNANSNQRFEEALKSLQTIEIGFANLIIAEIEQIEEILGKEKIIGNSLIKAALSLKKLDDNLSKIVEQFEDTPSAKRLNSLRQLAKEIQEITDDYGKSIENKHTHTSKEKIKKTILKEKLENLRTEYSRYYNWCDPETEIESSESNNEINSKIKIEVEWLESELKLLLNWLKPPKKGERRVGKTAKKYLTNIITAIKNIEKLLKSRELESTVFTEISKVIEADGTFKSEEYASTIITTKAGKIEREKARQRSVEVVEELLKKFALFSEEIETKELQGKELKKGDFSAEDEIRRKLNVVEDYF